jgi:hypothetical protein
MAEQTNICWETFGKSVKYTNKETGNSSIFTVGDTITFEGRPATEPLVVITEFTGKDLNGPIGMCYLPWRSYKNCWATPTMTFKGNPRHIICYPSGNLNYGLHIDWSTVRHMDSLEDPLYQSFIQSLLK